MLEAHSISKSFGSFKALQEVSLMVPKQSVFGLFGPNGAGKTTLIRIINQITMPDSGHVLLDGEPLRPDHIRYIGYLPEERGLYKTMKVGEQVIYLAQLKGLSKSDAKAQLKYWFDRLDIGHWWDKKVQELSKGMAQKIQFVVTVLHRPKLLIFDEPFSGFDPINAQLIREEILNLRDQGATVIFSTHRMESVEEMCDHIALMNKSKKILDGNLMDIKRAYQSNVFRVGIKSADKAGTWKILEEQFGATPVVFKSIHEEVQCKLQLPDGHGPNDLFAQLSKFGEISHFVQEVPTANDIFIQSIHQNEAIL